MSSLAALKEKLAKKTKRNSNDCSEDGKCIEEQDLDTYEIQEQEKWEKRLHEEGTNPEVWLEYIDWLNKKVYSNDFDKYYRLSNVYQQAVKDIPHQRNKKNGQYARLWLNYAKLKSEFNPDEAESVLDSAKCFVRRFAVVYVACAEFEVQLGNVSKAKKLLNKALLYNSEPTILIDIALRNLQAGLSELLTDEERETGFNIEIKDEELEITENSTHNQSGIDMKTEEYNTAPLLQSITHPNSTLSSSCKPCIRHYKSTPECRSKLLSSNPFSANKFNRLLNPNKSNIVPPMRVKLKLPCTDSNGLEETVEEDSTINSFKPLDSFHRTNETFGAHSSGYVSSTTNDLTDHSVTNDNHNHVNTQDLGQPSGHSTMDLSLQTPNKRQCTEETNSAAHTSSDNSSAEMPQVTSDDGQAENNTPSSMEISCNESSLPLQQEVEKKEKRNVEEDNDVKADISEKENKVVEYDVPIKNVSETSIKVEKREMPLPKIVSQPQAVLQPIMHQPIPTPIKVGCDVKYVNGHAYTVLKLAGRGGSAKVYQVLDEKNNVRALKCVDLDGSADVIIEGYKNEINLLKRLQYCDAVIKMFDYEFDDVNNKLNVILEYGETDLAVHLSSRKRGGKNLDTAIKFYWQEMLSAVNALHKEGIIHSDLKPANFIFVAAYLKLIDFGIADAVQQDKTSVFRDVTMGTVSYMSPEAIKESCDGQAKYKISVRSDVWSLGCILYNMVYGKTPFQHIRQQLARIQAITDDNHPIDFPDIPDKLLLDVLKKCLNRDCRSRPTTDELLNHPYLTQKTTEESPVASSHKPRSLQNLLDQISEFSPRSMQTFQGLVQKMGK